MNLITRTYLPNGGYFYAPIFGGEMHLVLSNQPNNNDRISFLNVRCLTYIENDIWFLFGPSAKLYNRIRILETGKFQLMQDGATVHAGAQFDHLTMFGTINAEPR